ncbi:hypothetical protein CR513_10830, partial [Mucuna pruriens]
MENIDSQFILEGASLTQPPTFIGEDYPYWRDNNVYQVYSIQLVNKPKKDSTQDNYNTLQLNAKARYIITCALSKSKYNKYCNYKVAKNM